MLGLRSLIVYALLGFAACQMDDSEARCRAADADSGSAAQDVVFDTFGEGVGVPCDNSTCKEVGEVLLTFQFTVEVENFLGGFRNPCPSSDLEGRNNNFLWDQEDRFGNPVTCTNDGSQYGEVLYLKDVGYTVTAPNVAITPDDIVSMIVSETFPEEFPYIYGPLPPPEDECNGLLTATNDPCGADRNGMSAPPGSGSIFTGRYLNIHITNKNFSVLQFDFVREATGGPVDINSFFEIVLYDFDQDRGDFEQAKSREQLFVPSQGEPVPVNADSLCAYGLKRATWRVEEFGLAEEIQCTADPSKFPPSLSAFTGGVFCTSTRLGFQDLQCQFPGRGRDPLPEEIQRDPASCINGLSWFDAAFDDPCSLDPPAITNEGGGCDATREDGSLCYISPNADQPCAEPGVTDDCNSFDSNVVCDDGNPNQDVLSFCDLTRHQASRAVVISSNGLGAGVPFIFGIATPRGITYEEEGGENFRTGEVDATTRTIDVTRAGGGPAPAFYAGTGLNPRNFLFGISPRFDVCPPPPPPPPFCEVCTDIPEKCSDPEVCGGCLNVANPGLNARDCRLPAPGRIEENNCFEGPDDCTPYQQCEVCLNIPDQDMRFCSNNCVQCEPFVEGVSCGDFAQGCSERCDKYLACGPTLFKECMPFPPPFPPPYPPTKIINYDPQRVVNEAKAKQNLMEAQAKKAAALAARGH